MPPDLQRHIAWASVAPTTLRGMLDVGGRRVVCTYLANIDVNSVTAANYQSFLEDSTASLKLKIANRWGPARKAVNLFMRDMTYNHWSRESLRLHKVEFLLELPLDGRTMKRIAKTLESRKLRPVPVIALDEVRSKEFQDAATEIAEAQGIARVHLDLQWWSNDEST